MYLLPTPGKTVFEEQLRTEIEWKLFRMGFNPDLKGFVFIRDVILMFIDNSNMVFSITKTIYSEIAKINNTNISVVERAIQLSIKTAWDKDGENTLHNYFSDYPDNPTNRTVLAFVYMYMNTELSTSINLVLIK